MVPGAGGAVEGVSGYRAFDGATAEPDESVL